MLAKKERLTSQEVRSVMRRGKPLRHKDILAKFTPATQGKAAVVVSSKVAKNATARNRLRRSAYGALKAPLPSYHVVFFIQSAGFDPRDIALICSKLS